MCMSSAANERQARSFLEMIFKAAIPAPYLMDQLLAFSALHLSTLTDNTAEKQYYHYEASKLQTRALGAFNKASPEVSRENCMSMFFFSAILNMSVFFDAMITKSDFLDFLEKFIQFLTLQRRIRAVTGPVWSIIRETDMRIILDPIEAAGELQHEMSDIADHCDQIINLLDTCSSSIGPTTVAVCRDTLQSLKQVQSQYRCLSGPNREHLVMAWPALISEEFILLLKQRRQEALVIVAHWATLLHFHRDLWVFGDTGQYLIASIAHFLGPSWTEWMSWPMEIIKGI
ncbi:hypothetical protein Plec18170_001905 [Paecilomyces lecythidis]